MSRDIPPAIDSTRHANGHANGHAHAANGHETNGHAVHSRQEDGNGVTAALETPTLVRSRSNGAVAHPSISLIIPALNEEKLIERTLVAFGAELRERYNAEMIVSDGGSHDRTVEIAREHADHVVVHTEKRRQTIAEGRNRGAEVARGDLLVFINADTVPRSPEAFMRELQRIAGSPRRRIAYACPVEVMPDERRLSDRLFHGFFNNYVRLLNGIGVGMGRGECQVTWRDSFRSVGGYDNAMAAGEDFDLYSRLARHGSIGHDANLCVYESPRRFRRYGYIRVLASWTANALSVIFLHRSISKEWEEIR